MGSQCLKGRRCVCNFVVCVYVCVCVCVCVCICVSVCVGGWVWGATQQTYHTHLLTYRTSTWGPTVKICSSR